MNSTGCLCAANTGCIDRSEGLTLDQVELFGTPQVDVCARRYRALRKQGITIRKTADVIIASFCITHDMPLLFRDRDFQPFVDHLGLKPALDPTQTGNDR